MIIDNKIAIVGAGLGGLAAAIRLAKNGYEVHIFEKNLQPGGKAGVISEGRFRFDTGPSLLTMPFILEELFQYAGEDIKNYLSVEKLNELCKYYFHDGSNLTAYSNLDKFADEINNKTSESYSNVRKYFDYCKNIYDLTADLFLYHIPKNIMNYFSLGALNTLLKINKIDPFRTMHEANSKFFKDEKVIQLFDRYATYSGSSPFLAPATLNIIPYVEFFLGGYFVKEGIYSIADSLFKVAKKIGVNFHFNSPVERIIIESNSIKGIIVNNEVLDFHRVVSNADISFTYNTLLNKKPGQKNNTSGYEPSLSGLIFYLGIRGLYPGLGIHNILFSENYKKEFEDIFEAKICPEDPTVYIHISSKYKANDAPEGHENWFVMINTPHVENQDWEKEIERSRKNIIKKINKILKIDITNRIVSEKILTPQDIQKSSNSFKGSIYGISSNSKKNAFMRHPNTSSKVRELYFCGGSVHPGGGIPLVLLSGKNVSELILKKDMYGKRNHLIKNNKFSAN